MNWPLLTFVIYTIVFMLFAGVVYCFAKRQPRKTQKANNRLLDIILTILDFWW